MMFEGQELHRRSVRLSGYDYSQPGAYFVTMVTAGRKCLFGEIVESEMSANAAGKIVRYEWDDLLRRFRSSEPGAFVVMPNHFHGILITHPGVGATLQAPLAPSEKTVPRLTEPWLDPGGSPLRLRGLLPHSLGALIAGFKSSITRQINLLRSTPKVPVWQRNYYEHVIRNEKDWDRINRYIESNPCTWAMDEENPQIPHSI
jgi:putative transposase